MLLKTGAMLYLVAKTGVMLYLTLNFYGEDLNTLISFYFFMSILGVMYSVIYYMIVILAIFKEWGWFFLCSQTTLKTYEIVSIYTTTFYISYTRHLNLSFFWQFTLQPFIFLAIHTTTFQFFGNSHYNLSVFWQFTLTDR